MNEVDEYQRHLAILDDQVNHLAQQLHDVQLRLDILYPKPGRPHQKKNGEFNADEVDHGQNG